MFPRQVKRRPPGLLKSSPPDDGSRDDFTVALAVIVKPHGLDGEVKVELFTDSPEQMSQLDGLLLDGRAVHVQSVRGITGSRALLKLDGIDSREQADKLRGKMLGIAQKNVAPLPEGAFYDFQIIGLTVVTGDGQDLGRITEILRTGANDVYLTDQIAVPAVDRFIRNISLERGEMVVQDLDELMK